MTPDAAGMLGILNRAKLIAFGPAVIGAMRKAHLLLLAKDGSSWTIKEALAEAEKYHVQVHYVDQKTELGQPLGRDELTAVAVLSKKAAASLLSKLQKGETP